MGSELDSITILNATCEGQDLGILESVLDFIRANGPGSRPMVIQFESAAGAKIKTQTEEVGGAAEHRVVSSTHFDQHLIISPLTSPLFERRSQKNDSD